MIPRRPLQRITKIRRLTRSKAVTIAAGFNFADGVMVCADTEMTEGGLAKYHEQKIFPIEFGGAGKGPILAFAITGLAGQAKRAVEFCQVAIRQHHLRDSTNMSNEVIRDIIEGALLSFYKKFVFCHPHYKQNESWIELVIGLWSHVTGRSSVLFTDGPTVSFAGQFAFAGIGAYFARYACGRLFKPRMSLRDMTILAAHVLAQTKANVPGCGKQSQFVVIANEGKLSPTSQFDVELGEVETQAYLNLTNDLMFALANPSEDLEKIIEKFRQKATELRERINSIEYYQSLIGVLSGAVPLSSSGSQPFDQTQIIFNENLD